MIHLVRLCISSWFSFGRLRDSRNSSISSRWSSLLACDCSQRSLMTLSTLWCWFLVLPFHFVFNLLGPLSSLLDSLAKDLSVLSFSKNSSWFADLFYCFLVSTLSPLWSLLAPFFCWLGALFILLFLVPLDGRLDCFCEIFLVSWGRSVAL